ncbi:MAG: family 78 glycoside hydrolase catalytic domain [Tannerella sp.]|jgi:alpha-L-rhamnosidase|nr:family 78 glycoside hydrolase catalytic domain [Tannerella sp.]
MRKGTFLLVFSLLSGGYALAQAMSVENLRCEYMQNPLGIDVPQPRFSWELTAAGKNRKQTAYQITVADDDPAAGATAKEAWDSGKRTGDETNQIRYGGPRLKPFTCYYWKVRVWDEQGKPSAWSRAAKFSTGALSKSDWTAQWIGDADVPLTRENRYYPHLGYFSDYADRPATEKWVVIDLGETQAVDEVRLYPADRKEKLFPLHFKVETAEDRAFAGARIVAFALNGEAAEQTFPFVAKLSAPVRGRYVKLTVTRLPSVKENIYEYGLSEIEVLYQGKNLALDKPVEASDEKIEYRWGDGDCRWSPFLLTDGYYKATPGDYYANIPPSPLLRKEIRIGRKKIRHALYHTSALGLYEARINGKKVGRQCLAPEWTDYDRHVQYQTHDVTHMLQPGVNALGVMLADGWYSGTRWSHPGRGGYGSLARKFIGQLVVSYDDGTSETFATDPTWKYLAQGPITQVTTFGGEEYDARNDPKGWDRPGFDDSAWSAPALYPDEDANLCAQMNEPIAVVAEHKAIAVHRVGEQTYIFDLGQNIAGWCRLSLPYNPGQTVTLRYGEALNDDRTLYTENLRGARQTDLYHPGSEKRIDYEPRFTYHGFRYVEVSGLTQPPRPGVLCGKMIASSSPVTGRFVTSNRDVNKLWENIRQTQWGNLISVPTDCPQRDEREGWTGDAQVFSQTAIYNLDMAGFYTKWMRDIRDDQLPDGRLPDVSPNDGQWRSFYNAPGWADAGVIIPWRMYQNYGDTSLLAQQYDAMKRFIDFIHRRNPDLRWRFSRGHMYGDWLNGNTIVADDYPNRGGELPHDVYSTIYFAYSTSLLAQTARLLGRENEHAYYAALAAGIRQAFADAYVSPDGKIEGDTQAGYAMALEWDMIPEALREKAAAHMAKAIEAYDGRISTGIHSTIRLMKQLSDRGYADLAYSLLTSRRFPSWLYSIDQGATTIWERWDGYVAGRGFQSPGMNSLNHVAIGAVGEWMYSHILGIRPDESRPGYRRFTVRPLPGGGLEWVKGSYHAIAGLIEVAWTDRNRTFTLDVTVPPNTEAAIVMPYGDRTYDVGSGKHRFSVNY